MNRTKLKAYAPKARREFIQAVTDRAAHYGLTKKKIEPVTEEGDVAIIAGRPFPRKVADKRRKLENRINRQGFDQVIGKVVKSEDIPAATQLFTPNWIVKYLVQNSPGRQWLAVYPDSSLKAQMEYYIEPSDQTPEVQTKLAEITPDSLNPEELTCLDPACGSGHILAEAYDLLKAIYLERGYPKKDIPRLILEKNLYGLEIDDRAAQLAAFALLMKARADDRRIFASGVQPHILSIQESNGLDAKEITEALNTPILKEKLPPSGELFAEIAEEKSPLFSKKNLSVKGDISQADVAHLIELFEHGKTFGSLIRIPGNLTPGLQSVTGRVQDVIAHGDLLQQSVARSIRPILETATVLSLQYSTVVANPPYMGGKGMNSLLKSFGKDKYPKGKSDLFAMFIERLLKMTWTDGRTGVMSPFTWMFISSYESLRDWILDDNAITALVQPEYHAFFESAYVPICAFVIANTKADIRGDYIRLTDFYGEDVQPQTALEAIHDPGCSWRYAASADDFRKIPGHPLAYWISDAERDTYLDGRVLSNYAKPRKGMDTGDNATFLHLWHEVPIDSSCLDGGGNRQAKWYPYNKGGEYRRWYGNREYVVNWENDGAEIKSRQQWKKKKPTLRNQQFYSQEGFTWTTVSSSGYSARYTPPGALFDNGGCTLFNLSGMMHLSRNLLRKRDLIDSDHRLALDSAMFSRSVPPILRQAVPGRPP